jgi:uncharacterized protein
MGHFVRFLLFFTGCLLISVVVSPWLYLGVQWVSAVGAGPLDGIFDYLARHPYHRYFKRVFQISALLGIWPLIRQTGFGNLRSFGLNSDRAGFSWLAGGFFSSLLLLGAYLLVLVLVGVREWKEMGDFNLPGMLIRIGLTAMFVSLFEEVFFRGWLYQLMKREKGVVLAVVFNMVFFAIVHYINPTGLTGERIDAFSGFKLLSHGFHRFGDPMEILGGLILLGAIAAMLCWSLERTGSLALAIGLHAGWIFALQWGGEITLAAGGDGFPTWVLGGGNPSQGVMALVPLALQFLLVQLWLGRANGRPK